MMLNNDGNAGNLAADSHGLLTLLRRYMKLEAIDKLSVATTFLVVAGVIFALGASAIFFLCSGLVMTLSAYVGGVANANYVVGGLLVLMIIVFYINRKAWVERRIVRNISEAMLKTQKEDEEDIV